MAVGQGSNSSDLGLLPWPGFSLKVGAGGGPHVSGTEPCFLLLLCYWGAAGLCPLLLRQGAPPFPPWDSSPLPTPCPHPSTRSPPVHPLSTQCPLLGSLGVICTSVA